MDACKCVDLKLTLLKIRANKIKKHKTNPTTNKPTIKQKKPRSFKFYNLANHLIIPRWNNMAVYDEGVIEY